ncbi:F-box domain-containing protein [Pleurotus pulmonarius]
MQIPTEILLAIIEETSKRITTTLVFEYKCSSSRGDTISRAHILISRILPHLPNLRSLTVIFIPSEAVDPAILQLLPSTARLTDIYLACGLYRASFLQHIVLFPTLEDIAVPDFYPKDAETQAIKLSSKELPNVRSLTISVEESLLFDNLPSLVSLVITSDRISSFVEPELAIRHISGAFASIRFLALQFVGMDTMASLLSCFLNLEYISILDPPSSPSQAHDLSVIFSRTTNIKLKYLQFGYSEYDFLPPLAQTLLDSMKHLVIVDWNSKKGARRLGKGWKTVIPIIDSSTPSDRWEHMRQAVEDHVRRNTKTRR